jgi:hypothetical protein
MVLTITLFAVLLGLLGMQNHEVCYGLYKKLRHDV